MIKNENGFSVLEVLVIILIIGLLGVVGWLVYDRQNLKRTSTASNTQVNAQQQNVQSPSKEVVTDPTKDWTAYSNKEGHFSLKYPPTWVTASSPEYCSPGILLLGANANTVGKCASDGFGQIAIQSNSSSSTDNGELNSSNYPDLKSETVTINNVTGKRQTGTYKATSEGIGPATGDKIVQYTFSTNGRTYIATYNIQPSYPDVLKDFDILVTKTLKFQP